MTPYYADDWLTVFLGDCREVMAAMEPESVHCVVTSPPYWGLRDYGIGGQLGLEPTPEAYVEAMVAVFREVRRVLRKDGTVWLNLGDSYAANRPGAAYAAPKELPPGLKPKDLVGIPWRVAFALQADGWYLRSDIIWAKPNPMPESVTDRPTKAHEYVFLLSKSSRYYYDADAVREPHSSYEATAARKTDHNKRAGTGAWSRGVVYDGADVVGPQANGLSDGRSRLDYFHAAGRNLRSVWNIATEPYPGAHFATFPRALVEPCIKAGTSEKGVCPECGAPWVREVEREGGERYATGKSAAKNGAGLATAFSGYTDGSSAPTFTTIGWHPSCLCATMVGTVDGDAVDWAPDTVPATVLDPFAGSGTTGLVAQSLSRRAVLIDLSADYLEQLMDRNQDIPLGLAGA